MDLKKKKLFLLDMDGTIYLDDNLFCCVKEFLKYVKDTGGKYLFVTNNSSRGSDRYVEKLARLGISSTEDDFISSTEATVLYLKKKAYKKIYVFGTDSFKHRLSMSGLPVTDTLSDDTDCLCLAYDTELTYKKLEDACKLLNRDIDYVATNPDLTCPTEYGYVPDCGSIAEMIYNATKKRPKFIGKPEPEMVLLAMEKYGYKKDDTVIIGDRLYTDIACGINSGVSSIFVLSGEGTEEDIQKYKITPDYIYKDIKELYEFLTSAD